MNKGRVDFGFWGIVALLGIVAIWLLLMPWVPAIAACTLHRFHLRSSSFLAWAAQQSIPSMYNFANRVEVRNLPPNDQLMGLIDPVLMEPVVADPVSNVIDVDASKVAQPIGRLALMTLNHFPSRIFTFGDARSYWLSSGQPRWFVLRSSYRGQSVQSVYYLHRDDDQWIADLESSESSRGR